MAGMTVLFRDLHRAHRLVRDLRTALTELPDKLAKQRRALVKQETVLKDAQDALKKLRVFCLDKEGALKSKLQQIDKYERQTNEVTTKKELDALNTEIKHAREQCSTLEEEILQAMTGIDRQTTDLPGIESATRAAREEFALFESRTKEREAGVRAQLAEAEAALSQVEAGLPQDEDMRRAYRRMVQSIGADTLSPVKDRICVACSTELSVQTRSELLMGRVVNCKSCSRFLYLTE